MKVREQVRTIRETGWEEYSIWEHSAHIRELYTRRCSGEAEEMTCAAQAARLLQGRVRAGETVLDVGCGGGYFWHSLRKRQIPTEYIGIDASATLIDIGRRYLPSFGLSAKALKVMRIEDLAGVVDHIVCMNVLSYLDNYHRSLERLLKTARGTVIIRESLSEQGTYKYVNDRFLDEGIELKVYVNTYPVNEVMDFVRSYGWSVRLIEDEYTGGKLQSVIGYPHYWSFLIAEH